MALSSSYGSWQQGPAVSHLHAAHARSEHREDCGLSQLAFEMEMDSESDCSILSCRTASTSSSSTMTSESESEEGKSKNHGTYFSMEFDQHLSALDTKIDLEEDDASCLRRPRTGGHSGIASNSDSIDSAPSVLQYVAAKCVAVCCSQRDMEISHMSLSLPLSFSHSQLWKHVVLTHYSGKVTLKGKHRAFSAITNGD